MSKIMRIAVFALLVIFFTGCNFPGLSTTPTETEPFQPGPTHTESTPRTTAPPQIDTPVPSACTLSAISDVPAYFRPSTESNLFSTLSAGTSFEAIARTADGWIGFEPGVAQAANTGIFRLRWVEETSNVSLDGACASLPIVEGPAAGICFTMLMGDTPVYEEADPASSLVATLTSQEYAAVTGRKPDQWYRVDLAIGDTSSNQAGWVEASAINLNGPCDSLPVINIPSGQTFTPAGINCTLTADADITLYSRPFPTPDTFSTLSTGMSVPAAARTPGGWIGIDPGIPQAANVDVFRLRWVESDASFTLTGNCGNLPTVIGPPPYVCFNMAMEDIPIYAETNPSSPIVATLLDEEYAAVTAQTPNNWYRIDLGFGNSISNQAGWMEGTMPNFNGYCDEVPVVTP